MARSGGRPNQRLAAVPQPCRALERAVPVPVLRAGVQAQARARWWAGPGTDTGQAVSHRASAMLFCIGPVLAQRAWPIWKTIEASVRRHGVADDVSLSTATNIMQPAILNMSYILNTK